MTCAGTTGLATVKALDQVNLHVDVTAFVVVLGTCGSGKTIAKFRRSAAPYAEKTEPIRLSEFSWLGGTAPGAVSGPWS